MILIVLILELQITLGGNEGAHHCFIIRNEINRLYWELTKHEKKHKSELQIWSAHLSTVQITNYPGTELLKCALTGHRSALWSWMQLSLPYTRLLSPRTTHILNWIILCCWVFPMHCRMFKSIPGLYFLDASSLLQTKMSPYVVKCPLGAKISPA